MEVTRIKRAWKQKHCPGGFEIFKSFLSHVIALNSLPIIRDVI